MIRITNLTKFHGTTKILDGVSLAVAEGEVTALVGPSGGGKSTLLRCVNGLETFTDGSVEAFGVTLTGRGGKPHPPATLQSLRRNVGMVFQQFHLFQHMTARENVASGPRFALGKSISESNAIAEKLLDRVGLKDKVGHRPGQLSGGQQQRVAIARCLAVSPKAVLFDEPTSALDPAMADEVLAVMRDLARGGLTMIVVTHDMDFARQATVIHRMVAGTVAASGTPAEILDTPRES